MTMEGEKEVNKMEWIFRKMWSERRQKTINRIKPVNFVLVRS